MPRPVSSSGSPSSTIRPRSGRSRPAIAVDHRRLAGTRAAEQRRDAARGREADVERSSAPRRQAMSTSSIRRRAPSGPRARQQLRGDHRGEGEGDRHQRQAQGTGLAAGDLGEGVDRRGQGLGLARDVGDEGDGGAELAQRLGIGQHHAGHHAGQRQGQGDRGEHPRRPAPKRAGRLLQPAVDRLERQPHRAHQKRKRHHAAGQRGPGPAEREHDAQILGQWRSEKPAPAEGEQQQVAGHHRRHHQRQVDHAVEQQLAGKVPARQRVGDEQPERQAAEGGPQGHLQAQPDRLSSSGAKLHTGRGSGCGRTDQA